MSGGEALRVAVVQTAPRLGERAANLADMAARARAAAADLTVFPELATCGYAFGARDAVADLAERPGGSPGLDALQALAEELRGALVAGLPLAEGGRLYNAAALLRPGAEPVFYRKLHLFYREPELFDAGDAPPRVHEFRGLRLGLMICFDWIFPELARHLALAGADLIAQPANLVLTLCQDAMVTRAVENRVWTLTANRVGEERFPDGETLRFTGGSQVVDPCGRRVLALPVGEPAAGTADVDPAAARDKMVTARNHVLDDRRPALYRSLVAEDR
ncbi:MAG: hypothetical protein JW819_11770 [Candidatus Krumholzibacteriota bacterium]|nr:hypothetical protein [Candidatus Krumholzibacteriota bacterium]